MKTYRCLAERICNTVWKHPAKGEVFIGEWIAKVEVEWSLPDELDTEVFKTNESLWSEYDHEICWGNGEQYSWDFTNATDGKELEKIFFKDEFNFDYYLLDSGWEVDDQVVRVIGPLMDDTWC